MFGTGFTGDGTRRRYFDQGLMFMFAYNHDEAVRAFRQAADLDPGCAMAYWGIALASGMNYNDPPFVPEKAKVASEALAKARAKAKAEAAANKALIDALAARYPDPALNKRADAEKAYSRAMKAAWEKYPKDADVGALYAESLMNLRPWDLWASDGKPQPETPEILGTQEAVLKLAPSHPLANHLYIHAVEASPEPGKADAAADALRGQHPALGHLLHMPSHIDIRRGRWQQAVEANRLAIRADGDYQKAVPEQGFYRMYMAHNHHMLTFAALMQGESALALKTTREMIAAVPKEWAAAKENAAIVDGFAAMPLEVLKRFGRWDDILKDREPPEAFPIARSVAEQPRRRAGRQGEGQGDPRNPEELPRRRREGPGGRPVWQQQGVGPAGDRRALGVVSSVGMGRSRRRRWYWRRRARRFSSLSAAQRAQWPPGIGNLRACTQPTFRQRCRVAAGIPSWRARSVNSHSPGQSIPAAERASGRGPLRPPLARNPPTMLAVKRAARLGGWKSSSFRHCATWAIDKPCSCNSVIRARRRG
jgi:tetratricopeptide (TPR) repeat protein